jgi:chemotaxis regulatin CheY-phosphate phosphatase CheZ
MTNKPAVPERLQAEVHQLSEAIVTMVENFKKLQIPLVDSQEKVPQATRQLDKISQQTEAAAHRVLDVVEQITERETEVVDGLTELKAKLGGKSINDFNDHIDALISKSTKTCNDAYAIMDTLQFQDIAAQQMNHAAELLGEIERKLQEVALVMRGESGKITKANKPRVYDPHADMFDQKTRQEDIDNLFSKK